MQITRGVERQDIAEAAQLYWLACGGKLGRVMGPEHRATAYNQRALGTDHAICAHDQSGTLIGIAGFKTYDGALVGGRFRDLAAVYAKLMAGHSATRCSEPDSDDCMFLQQRIPTSADAASA